MHVSIVAYGTWGDVHPSVQLTRVLRSSGFPARLLVTADFLAWARRSELPVRALPIRKLAVMKRVSSRTNPLRVSLAIHRRIVPGLIAAGQSLLEYAPETDVLLVNEWLLAMAAGIAEVHDLKLVHLAMKPRVPTRERPIPTMPRPPEWAPFAEAYHRTSYDLARCLRWWTYARSANVLRERQLGLPPLSFQDYLRLIEETPSITLVSRHVVPRPRDWPAHHHQTGFLFYDDRGWQPPSKLVSFLREGPAPVYLGFGSMHDDDPAETTRLILEALDQSAERALLHRGWAELGGGNLPDHVHPVGYAPHAWLFPRVAAVVHHAGAGTSAAALRAGVPSVPVPHSGDQQFWADRLHRLGAATDPLPRSNLSVGALADRIQRAMDDPRLSETASKLSAAIHSDAAEARTVEALEAILES